MKITVDRVENADNELVFTIKSTDPHQVPFGLEERHIMRMLDECQKKISDFSSENTSKTSEEALSLLNEAKGVFFDKALICMKAAIEDNLRTKFRPICQEIYNWIYNHQDGELKSWLSEFDLVRTRYYFDNDPQINKKEIPQESEHDEDDDEDEDDDD